MRVSLLLSAFSLFLFSFFFKFVSPFFSFFLVFSFILFFILVSLLLSIFSLSFHCFFMSLSLFFRFFLLIIPRFLSSLLRGFNVHEGIRAAQQVTCACTRDLNNLAYTYPTEPPVNQLSCSKTLFVAALMGGSCSPSPCVRTLHLPPRSSG